jgi:hypothetical protein
VSAAFLAWRIPMHDSEYIACPCCGERMRFVRTGSPRRSKLRCRHSNASRAALWLQQKHCVAACSLCLKGNIPIELASVALSTVLCIRSPAEKDRALVLRCTKTTALVLRRTNFSSSNCGHCLKLVQFSERNNRIAAAWNADTQQGTHGSRGLI